MGVCIVGTGHTKFGKLRESLYELVVKAGREAIEDAGIDASEIGGVWIGNYGAMGFNNQGHLGPVALEIDPSLRFKPCVRVENACASSMAALKAAACAVELGEVRFALVVGVEKMTSLDTPGITHVLATGSYWPEEGVKGMTFPGLFAEYAKGYQARYGFSDDEMRVMFAKVAAKNHTNALDNPLAQMPLKITYEEILNLPDRRNPFIAPPLRMFDCSLISDGAAALVITSREDALSLGKDIVEVVTISHVSDYLSLGKRANYEFTAGKLAVKQAYNKAGICVWDLDFAEVHDCFTIAEILAYETLGIKEDGKGREALDEGIVYRDGKLPVNLSGGLKAKGHPVGATGASMAVIAFRQLTGKALGYQLPSPELGLVFNIGGSAASNYAAVFRRLK